MDKLTDFVKIVQWASIKVKTISPPKERRLALCQMARFNFLKMK